MVTYMIPDLSIGMLQKLPTDAVVVCWHNCFHTAFSPWGDHQRDVIPTLGLFCCASRCQMPDPTAALRQWLRFFHCSCYADDAASTRSQATEEGTLKSASQEPDTT